MPSAEPLNGAADDIRNCQQLVLESDGCCASRDGICASAAAWQHTEGGVALCEVHARNAEIYGGIQLGYWVVGKTRVPYPEGWTHIDDGRPLEVVVPPPVQQVAEPGVRPSGLILP
jgi:hypothetical protein